MHEDREWKAGPKKSILSSFELFFARFVFRVFS